MNTLSTSQMVTSLRSWICPACGGGKRSMHSLCIGCYRVLPQALKTNLHNKIGQGYESAMSEALKALDVQDPHIPGAA